MTNEVNTEFMRIAAEKNRAVASGEFTQDLDGTTFIQHPEVFSPYAWNVNSSLYTRHFPYINDASLLEIGCGIGAVSIIAALRYNNRVIATDINAKAIEIAKKNADLHKIAERVDCREGSLFEPIQSKEKFDQIYWNWPFCYTPRSYTHKDPLERAFSDPGYQLIDTFLSESRAYLRPTGKVILTFGSLGNFDLFDSLVKKYHFSMKTIIEETLSNGRTYWIYQLA